MKQGKLWNSRPPKSVVSSDNFYSGSKDTLIYEKLEYVGIFPVLTVHLLGSMW